MKKLEWVLAAAAVVLFFALDARLGDEVASYGQGAPEGETVFYPAVGRGVPVPLDKQLEILRDLGIEVTEEQEQEMRGGGAEAMDYLEEMPYVSVLSWIGFGDYDYDTGAWTPTSSQVFEWDMEVYDIENMYPLFMEGLQAISGLDFTDALQDNSAVDWEQDTGYVAFTYRLNGNEYAYQAEWMGDWMDPGVLESVNGALAEEGVEERFRTAYDGGQGILVFFSDQAWARQFQRDTGLTLEEAVT